MSNNPYARPRFDRNLTAEEEEELNNVYYYISDDRYHIDDWNDSGSEYLPSESDSECDEPGIPEGILAVQWEEMVDSLQNVTNDELPEDAEEEEIAMPVRGNRGQKYVGQGRGNKTIWWSVPTASEVERTNELKRNRLTTRAHCKRNFDDIMDAFTQIFTPAIIEEIVIETNRKAKKVYDENRLSSSPKQMRPWLNTTTDEIYAYIAVLLHIGADKSNTESTNVLWEAGNMAFYRAVMSLKRFEQITRFLRFDNSRTRRERLKYDKLAPIRDIWNAFHTNLTMNFVPSLELCIDEQLLVTRNRCSFRQYIPSKPGKYGIKIFWLVDSVTNYPVAGEIYVGKQPNESRSKGIAHDLVMRLSKNYLNIGSNITMDNFFTSYELALDMAAHNTTIVGTVRRNKPTLPKTFAAIKEAEKRGKNTSAFCYSGPCELVSYNTDTNKNVCLLTTAHATEEICEESNKPAIVLDYNKHKGGVDTLDKMLRCFTCKRKCNRWPMVVFFNMLDVGALAAYRTIEVCHPITRNQNKKNSVPCKFIRNLAMKLAQNHLKTRSERQLKNSVRAAMTAIGFTAEDTENRPHNAIPKRQGSKPRARCEQCKQSNDKRKDIKTTSVCDYCLKPYCVHHLSKSCDKCLFSQNINNEENSEDDDDMPSTSRRQPRKRRRLSPI